MATWMTHLRIADRLLEYGFLLNKEPFLLGNLAPDINSISKKVTHFCDDYNNRMQPEDFYDAYLRDQSYEVDHFAFLVGYYVHLLVDVEWIGNVWRPLKHDQPELAKRIETDTDFAYEFKRREYFGQDFLYLHKHPDYTSWQIIQAVSAIPTYLEYLSGDSLLQWLRSEVIPIYEDVTALENAQNHDFPYLNQHGLQTWMDCCIGTMIEMLKGKQIPCPKPHPLWGGYIQPYS